MSTWRIARCPGHIVRRSAGYAPVDAREHGKPRAPLAVRARPGGLVLAGVSLAAQRAGGAYRPAEPPRGLRRLVPAGAAPPGAGQPAQAAPRGIRGAGAGAHARAARLA